MPEIEPTATCPRCGTQLSRAMRGLCPRCLAEGGLVPAERETLASAGQPGGDPPDPETLDVALPDIEIEELIGRGGMGAVYKGRQVGLNRPVAIKILSIDPPGNPEFVERFRLEALALAKLDHPNIVTVHGYGELEEFVYIVMEYVEGTDLANRIAAGDLDPRQSLDLVIQICQALQYAHDHGVVHRDIKPANILISIEGRVRIADFGLVKLLGQKDDSLTTGGERLGTPFYMAPEQRTGRAEVDHRADIYSLGVVFYEMLTGELPSGNFPPPSRRAREPLTSRVDPVVLKSMNPEPEQRFQQVSEVSRRVEEIREPRRIFGVPKPAAAMAAAAILIGLGAMIALFAPDVRGFLSQSIRNLFHPLPAFETVELDPDNRLTQAGPAGFDRAGHAIALRGSALVLGAPQGLYQDAPSGSGFVAVLSADDSGGWEETTRLVHPDAKRGDRFGHALLLDDRSLFVSASRADVDGQVDAGAVFVYRAPAGAAPDSWSLQQILTPPPGFGGTAFGQEMARHGNVLAVSAMGYPYGGAVCVYERAAADADWQFRVVVSPPEPTPHAYFGAGVALADGILAVAARDHDHPEFSDVGSVHLFTRDAGDGSWAPFARLFPEPLRAGLRAGLGLAFDGPDRLLVGVAGEAATTPLGEPQGSVQIFEPDRSGQWQFVAKFRPPGEPRPGSFGRRLLIQGDRLFVGSDNFNSADGSRRGAAYLFVRDSLSPAGWAPARQFVPSPIADPGWSGFGYQIAVDGDRAAFAIPLAGDDYKEGGAYVIGLSRFEDRKE